LTPFTDEGQTWCAIADPRYTLTCQISSGSVYSVAVWRRKIPIFAVFWTSACSGVVIWQQSEEIEYGCTTANIPLSNGIKIVSVFQHYLHEIVRTISDVQKRDEQTDKRAKKTQRFWPPRWRVKSEPHYTWHGGRGPRARSCTSETFVCPTHSFAARWRSKFGGTRPLYVNPFSKSNHTVTANVS